MKIKLFTFVMLLMVLQTAFAQQKKVAVYMTGEESGEKKVLGDQLAAAFARSGKYVAVERTASFLAELQKEHSYERTGAVKDSEIAALGVQFGVNYVCVADISEVFGEKYISARLIDVETAEIVNTHNVSGQMNSMNQCLQMAGEITKNLTKGTFAEQAESQRAEAERAEKDRLRKIEEERLAKERRLAELKAQGYVDLGLPSGTLWKNENEIGGWNNLFSYEQAVNQFGNRLPTKAQFKELKENCRWTWTGNGCKVIGPNGCSIYLPAAGFDGLNRKMYNVGVSGIYWSSTSSNSEDAWYLDFGESYVRVHDWLRKRLQSVRLVQSK